MRVSPLIIGVRHHSPACARLVATRIRALRPDFVLVEGPADFNPRIDELLLPHRLPVAIYSHASSDLRHHGSWTPFCAHSPEWLALQVGHEVGAQLRFIDLPAWHPAFAELENRYADSADADHGQHAQQYTTALAERLAVQGSDALWDHLFEDDGTDDELEPRLALHFQQLRGEDPGTLGTQAREQKMAAWIAWAQAQKVGRRAARVLVVCGGYHAPALRRLWPQQATGLPDTSEPAPQEIAQRHGSYLVPYTFKRLDAFSGYASGMPSPAYYQWLWQHGSEGAGRHLLQQVMQRLRGRKLPASTADLIAVQVRAEGLARLRGHRAPLRMDWLDALAGALLQQALEAPLPWTCRGALRAGTDPLLVEIMDVLAGDAAGQLAAGTPQPPLVAAVAAELAAHGLELRGSRELDLLDPADRARSQLLHRLLLLRLPGVVRSHGPAQALSDQHHEQWNLSQPMEQQAALIEAGAWGATLQDAARARLEDELRAADGRITPLVAGLNRAAWSGLSLVSTRLLAELRLAVANESRFEVLAPALGTLNTLLRHGQLLGIAHAPVLATVIEAGVDRALWLLEAPLAITPADMEAHLQGHLGLRQVVSDVLADADDGAPALLAVQPLRALAVWQRKAASAAAEPLSRGAALGALLSLSARLPPAPLQAAVPDAMGLLQQMAPSQVGDALSGLLALAREQLTSTPAFCSGLDAMVQAFDDHDFVQALPALRDAFAWLPPRERGDLATQVLRLHGADHLSTRTLTAAVSGEADAAQRAQAGVLETQVLAALTAWGIAVDLEEQG